MIEVRTQRKKRFWHQGSWWAWGAVLLCASYALGAPVSAHVAWYRRAIFETAAVVATHTTAVLRPLQAWWHGDAVHSVESDFHNALRLLEETRQERDRLQHLLTMAPNHQTPMLGARVVMQNVQAPFKMLIIDRGTDDGVMHGMIAVAVGGLLGRVERVTAHHATILLLTDPNHAVDVMTQRSRTRGMLIGHENAMDFQQQGMGRMAYLTGTGDIHPGDVVVTSGLDGRYPSGIPVGEVLHVERSAEGIVRSVDVLPYTDWNAVTEVGLLAAPVTIPAAAMMEATP